MLQLFLIHDNFYRVFSAAVWLSLLFTLLVLALGFYVSYYFYLFILQREDFLGPLHDNMDFFLITFTSFTEPDSIHWFPKFTAGKSKKKTLHKYQKN